MAKRDTPTANLEKMNQVLTAWKTLAPNAVFGKITLKEFEDSMQPSIDTRAEVEVADDVLSNKQSARNAADAVVMAEIQTVVKAVIGDPDYGDNSDLYARMGYVRKDDRASGLTQKKKPPAK